MVGEGYPPARPVRMVDTEDIGLATFQANRQNELAVRAEKL